MNPINNSILLTSNIIPLELRYGHRQEARYDVSPCWNIFKESKVNFFWFFPKHHPKTQVHDELPSEEVVLVPHTLQPLRGILSTNLDLKKSKNSWDVFIFEGQAIVPWMSKPESSKMKEKKSNSFFPQNNSPRFWLSGSSGALKRVIKAATRLAMMGKSSTTHWIMSTIMFIVMETKGPKTELKRKSLWLRPKKWNNAWVTYLYFLYPNWV